MNRQEAVLRELGLYPLWQRRALPAVDTNLAARGETEPRRVDTRSASTEAANSLAMLENAVPPEPVAISMTATKMVDALHVYTLQQPVTSENRANEFAPTPPQQPVAPEYHAHEFAPTPEQEAQLETLADRADEWATLREAVAGCQRCALHANCVQTVCGTGDEQAEWLLLGDWSSEEDDVEGAPFMGATGKLLDNILHAIGLDRQQKVYLTNVLKCRPPEAHHSMGSEIQHCLPYLHQQIELIRPHKILAFGNTAAHALLGGSAPLKELRGRVHRYQDIPVIVTYHPAYLLRSPLEKARVWEDLCLARDIPSAV